MTELRTAWGDWLGEVPWTHASTLTFQSACSSAAARRAIGRHLRDLDRRAHRAVRFFWVIERTCQGHVHLHVLVDAPLSAAEIRRSWKGGRAKVQQYDPDRGWSYYITKEIGDTALDWDVSRRAHARTTPKRQDYSTAVPSQVTR